MDSLERTVADWAIGWGLSRGKSPGADGRAARVEIDDEHRSTEWVIADPTSAELSGLAARAAAIPRSWVTIVGTAPDDLGGLEVFTRGECFMATTLRRDAGPAADVRLVERDGVAFATIRIDGVEAARGQVAIVGAHAVIDRIVTEPEFQRRGLGRAVMSELVGWALDRGATDGLLIASDDGFHLYSRLGWTVLAPVMMTAVPVGSPP